MTHAEIITEAWYQAGQPDNLDPTTLGAFDPASANALRWGLWLDAAKQAMLSWKRGGRQFWWSGAYREENLAVPGPIVGTIDVAPNGLGLSNPVGIALVAGDVLEVGGEQRVLMSPTAVAQPFLSTGAGLVGTVYSRQFSLANVVGYRSVQKVFFLDQAGGYSPLGRAERGNYVDTSLATVGSPSTYWVVGSSLRLDKAPEAASWLSMTVEANPPSCIDRVTNPLIPVVVGTPEYQEQWHAGLVLWMLGWGYGVMQDLLARQAMRNDFDSFMAGTLGELDTIMMSDQGNDPVIE